MTGFEALIGSTLGVFVGITLILAGAAAFMTGHALASHWRPMWQAAAYMVPLGLADRFLHYALFGGDLLSVGGYVIDSLILLAISLSAYRMTLARKMANQYPWLYRRTGLFTWEELGRGHIP